MTQPRQTGTAVERLRSALATLDFTTLGPVLSNDVQFGSCVGRQQVIEYLDRSFGRGVTVGRVEIEELPDRLVTTLELRTSEPPEQLPLGRERHLAVAFMNNDQIVELQAAENREQALGAARSPLPPRPATPTTLSALAAVLPVRDLAAALEHYKGLGFAVRAYHGGGYGYAERDGLNLHLNVVPSLNPATTTSAIYLYVEDAELLFAEWRSAGVSGQFFEPQDTEYGLREGAHVDCDGNLIRFGSRLREQA